jgi:hypothetical protein
MIFQTLKSAMALFILMLMPAIMPAQIQTLDDFENKEGWYFIQSDGVSLNLTNEPGMTGNAIRFDYDFTKGTGYGGIQKLIPLDLPENYEFTFYVKAESPSNNFEIKFADKSGDNVWWVNNRNYDFPEEWTKIRIKKRHIQFAWGPTEDTHLKRIDRIEFTIASFVGGKGTLWLDSFKFEPLPDETEIYPLPTATSASNLKKQPASFSIDGKVETFWQSSKTSNESMVIDCKTRREFGGMQIDWHEDFIPKGFDILLSMDDKNWEMVYSVASNQGKVSFIRLPETEAHFIKIQFNESNSTNGVGIREIKLLNIKESLTINDFLIYVATHSPKGDYPRYFLNQASFWTISGVNNDVKEAMINKDGMVEVDKGLFSIEPIVKMGDSLYNWSNVASAQTLGSSENETEFEFIPTVTWKIPGFSFETAITSVGEANINSKLNMGYKLKNTSDQPKYLELYLLIRPFQVNPYYQFLNHPGGAGKIKIIKEVNGQLQVDDKVVLFSKKYGSFGACDFNEGNPVDLIRNGKMPINSTATDKNGLAQGIVKYTLHLEAGEETILYATVPFHQNMASDENASASNKKAEFLQTVEFWKNKTGHIQFHLPPSADKIINTYHSNLAYILVNRDKVGIQPGSRSYERSWIRDGALTSSALLKSGIVPEVKDFISWYAAHQYENGKVPCVVDFRGPDPVAEHDSHGELIYLIREYFNFTHDTVFLQANNKCVLKAVDYIEAITAERSTEHFKNGNDSIRAYFGLVPESISHEGYSAKPMHSYWDNFFTMKGLKDAAEIQRILGETANYERISALRDEFNKNLYNSLRLAMLTRNIDYVPGCVELGDFDATSTTIALTPCNELKNLPKPQVYNTFDKYYEFFKNRRDSKLNWVNYTPYENRLIGSFIILDQPKRAHELIEFFLNDQRPGGWNHWAEVVWKDSCFAGFIGDMPHTWVGSDFINAIRSMFVYENEYDQSLVLASALYQDWIDAPQGMSVENLPTYYGEVSYSIKKESGYYRFNITGKLNLPENGIKIKNFNGAKLPKKVTLNGTEIKEYNEKEITIKQLPSEILIYY